MEEVRKKITLIKLLVVVIIGIMASPSLFSKCHREGKGFGE